MLYLLVFLFLLHFCCCCCCYSSCSGSLITVCPQTVIDTAFSCLQNDRLYLCMYSDRDWSGRDYWYLERIGSSTIRTEFDIC